MHKLPSRIAVVIISTVLLFVVTTGVSILWMTHALDQQALAQTRSQVHVARTTLLAKVRLLTIDYAKWDAAYEAVRAADLAWIFDNIGSAAMMGQAMQLAVVWGGPLTEDVGWTSGSEAPRTGMLPATLLSRAERLLADTARDSVDGTEFFAWHDGDLFVMGAARFEPVEHAAAIADEDLLAGQLIMGIRITDEVISRIADSILLTGAGITREPPSDRPFLEAPGVDGRPVAYIAWDLPRPGTSMLQRMLPLLTLLTLVAVFLAAIGMRLVRRSAHNLVSAEHLASVAAHTDALTGLPNRAAFNKALDAPARAGERAILFLDLNGFKRVNDSLGHAGGDAVIAATAARIGAVTGPGCLLARIAGDEFVLLVTDRDAKASVERLARAVDRAFDEPFDVMGHHIQLRAAIGYALQDADDMSGSALMRQADLAMYEGKRLRERAPVAFSRMMEDASHNARLVERALRTALSTRPNEIYVAYQPVVTMEGRFCHAEALARWRSPDHGQVPP
jgi:diguanylate cyclase (GGDEF)-like protein